MKTYWLVRRDGNWWLSHYRREAERKAHEMAVLVADLQRMRTQTARNAVELNYNHWNIFWNITEIFSTLGGGGPDDSLPGRDALPGHGAPRDRQGRNDGKLKITKLFIKCKRYSDDTYLITKNTVNNYIIYSSEEL